MGWNIKFATLRSALWGRGSFDGENDAFSPLVAGEALLAWPELESLRVLGVSGTELQRR